MEERHFDKNFGICFSFWDFLFGTAYDPGSEWPSVGLADMMPPSNVTEFLLYPFVDPPEAVKKQSLDAVHVKGSA